jgi:DNA-binding GntR family transcriptional regulator
MGKAKGYQVRSVQDSVYIALRDSIINLNLAPGTAISEKEISLRFEVSRTPVREAFIHLSKEGLVRVIPQKETLVSLIDFSRVEQEFFLRESLEIAVLESFIKNSLPAHFEELERFIEKQSAAFTADEYVNFVNYDDSFHRIFFDVTGQALSWEVLESMSGHYHRARLLTIRLNGIAKDIIDQHKSLLAALRKKDPAQARAVLHMHLHKLDTEEKILRGEFPSYFTSERERDIFDVDFGGLPRLH